MASTVDSEDQEDEDAFLRHITGVKPPNVISVVTMQLRRRGAQAWSQPCSLSPGRYSAGKHSPHQASSSMKAALSQHLRPLNAAPSAENTKLLSSLCRSRAN